MRLSSPSMSAALIDGAVDGGADVLDLGNGRDGDGLFRRRRAPARRRRLRHRVTQPEAVHGDEDRARGSAAGGRRVGAAGRARPRSEAVRPARAARSGDGEGHLGRVRRQGALVRRRLRDRAAQGRDRRGERDGGRDAAAGARASADQRCHLLLRAGRELPQPRAEPAAAGEPRVHRREDAGGARRPRRRLRRGRRPLLLRRRHRRVRARRLRHRAPRRVDPAEGAGRQRHLRRPREPRRAGDDRARRRHRADQPRRPRLHQAPHAARRAPSSAARSRRTTTSATSPRPTPASSRSCSCSS